MILLIYCIKRTRRNWNMDRHWKIPWKMKQKKSKSSSKIMVKNMIQFQKLNWCTKKYEKRIESDRQSKWRQQKDDGVNPNLAPHIEMRTRVFNSFKSQIPRSTGNNSKTLTSLAGMFNGLKKIQAYNKECVWKCMENAELSKAIKSATKSNETQGNY